MSKTQGELTIYLKSYLLAWSRHIRSHILEKRIHTNVDRVAWISTFEEALAKVIVRQYTNYQCPGVASNTMAGPALHMPLPSSELDSCHLQLNRRLAHLGALFAVIS